MMHEEMDILNLDYQNEAHSLSKSHDVSITETE